MIAKSHWHYKTVHMSSCHPEDSVSGTSRPLLINAQPRWSPDIFFAKVTKLLGVCTACLCWVRATLPSTDVSPIILFILWDGHTGCHLATGSPTGTILQACHLIQCDSLPLYRTERHSFTYMNRLGYEIEGGHTCVSLGRGVLNLYNPIVLLSFVNLTHVKVFEKRDPQLRKCPHEVGLGASLRGIFLMNDWLRGPSPLRLVSPPGLWSRVL